MNSYSEKMINSHSLFQPHSLELQNISFNKKKPKYKKSRGIHLTSLLYEHQRKKGDYKYLEKYVHKYFISFYINTKDDYNIRMIDDILNNESSHLVAEFKDYLIWGDYTEFLQKSYNMESINKYLPKIYDYYNSCSVIFPNYVVLHESKYIYKNIRKKQKVIDNQQEQEEKQERIKKGDIKIEDNDEFFGSKTFNSILDQTNTSNVRIFFGLNDNNTNNIDANETPNNIVEKLEKAENEAIQKKINLIKSKKKPIINNSNITENNNNTTNDIYNNSNSNSNLVNNNNNSKISFKTKYLKDKSKTKQNLHYLSTNKKTNININNSNANSKTNINSQKPNKMRISNYLSKNMKIDNDSKRHIKSNSNINDTDSDNNNNNGKNNYITIYGNNFINTKKKGKRKLFIENNNSKNYQIYIKNDSSNKNIKKQYINSFFPTKAIISRIFSNFSNNSVLKHNSFNFINKKFINKNLKEDYKYISPKFPLSPSSITIETNPFKNKYNYNFNINIKESNSARNVINHRINGKTKSNEKLNIKNFEDKVKRNKETIYYNSNTISSAITTKSSNIKDKIKYIHTNKNFNFNGSQIKNGNGYSNFSNLPNFKAITKSSRSNTNIKNKNLFNNININFNNLNYMNHHNNNITINDLNIHKINSTSNIKNPTNMNININTNNNSKNKIYVNEGSYRNIIENKIISKSPLSIEMETIKVTKRKRTLYPKTKTLSDINNKNPNIIVNNNFSGNIINNINSHTLSNDRHHLFDSIVHNSINSNNQGEDINGGIKGGLIMEEIKKKKNIILPFNKDINNDNNINININGYNSHGGNLTSRASNNVSKKKYKGNNGQEINYYNQEFKTKIKSQNMKKIITNNNLLSKNENLPVKIKRLLENKNINNNNKNIDAYKASGYFTSRK